MLSSHWPGLSWICSLSLTRQYARSTGGRQPYEGTRRPRAIPPDSPLQIDLGGPANHRAHVHASHEPTWLQAGDCGGTDHVLAGFPAAKPRSRDFCNCPISQPLERMLGEGTSVQCADIRRQPCSVWICARYCRCIGVRPFRRCPATSQGLNVMTAYSRYLASIPRSGYPCEGHSVGARRHSTRSSASTALYRELCLGILPEALYSEA